MSVVFTCFDMLLFRTFFGHSANEGIIGGLHSCPRETSEGGKEGREREREREEGMDVCGRVRHLADKCVRRVRKRERERETERERERARGSSSAIPRKTL